MLGLLFTLVAIAAAADQARDSGLLQPTTKRKFTPELAPEGSSGETVRLNDYRGKVVLLDF